VRSEPTSLARAEVRWSTRRVVRNAGIRVSILALAVSFIAGSFIAAAPAQESSPRCVELTRPDRRSRAFIAPADLGARADGDSLLALVNRTPSGVLAADYAPDDLVDLATMRPARAHECVPPRMQCLRADAARAYRALEAAMRAERLRPVVSSAFRGYVVQCATFLGWAQQERGGFCEAVTASALPGHSHHQLGTAIDLFDYEWNSGGNRFREGFGCTPAGLWIAAHAHEHGFVLSYPLHPDYVREGSSCAAIRGAESWIDPRTGYRYEPWHLRYVGVENAARYHAAWRASGPGTDGEITLEQFLRRERGDREELPAPVCDGCNCEECASFASEGPCARPAILLDTNGVAREPSGPPRLIDARLVRTGERVTLEARIEVPQNTMTQPPIATLESGAVFTVGQQGPRLEGPHGRPRERPDLDGAWRLAISPGERGDWPWTAALVGPRRHPIANGVHARIPAPPGELTISIAIDGLTPGTPVRVGLSTRSEVRDVRRLATP
jgi:LAS superfamily LD-carboxypeptidase LdcB